MRPRTPGAIVSREERNLSPLVSPWEGDDSLLAMSSVPGTRPDGSPYLARDLAAILQSAGFYAHLEKLQPREDEGTRVSASVTVPKVPRPPVFIALYTLLPHETGLTYVTKRMLWKCQWVSSEVLKCTAASTLLS